MKDKRPSVDLSKAKRFCAFWFSIYNKIEVMRVMSRIWLSVLSAILFCLSASTVTFAETKNTPKASAAKETKKPTSKIKKKLTPEQKMAKRHKKHLHLLSQMEKEMERYLAIFKKFSLPKVYYLRYRLRFRKNHSVGATDGVIVSQSKRKQPPSCSLKMDMRLGNHKFDQTGADGYDWKIYKSLLGVGSTCPAKMTDDLLKKMLWRKTDYAYRVGVGRYWRKRYVRSIKPKLFDKAGDFTREPATVYMAPLAPRSSFDRKRWASIVKRVSSITKKVPRVIHSKITVSQWEEVVLGVSNDGSKVRLRRFGYSWGMAMSVLAKNKSFLSTSRSGTTHLESELPTEAVLLKKMQEMWTALQAKAKAPEGDPGAGPAIVDPYLAGAIFYDILMVRLEAGRFLKKRNNRIYAKKKGKRILPSFLSIIDDPTQTHWKKTYLESHYLYDDEWVRARRMTMVQNGILKNFYMSRKPYKKYQRSNGHGRAAFGVGGFSRPGTTFVKSTREYSTDDLKKMLLKEMKRQGRRYGYILKRFEGYSNVRNMIYTVKPAFLHQLDAKTGKLTLLKGLRVRTSALQILSGILATGKDYVVFNGSDSEDSGTIKISTVAPSLLIQRLDFTRVQGQEKKNYELPPPFKPEVLKVVTKKPKSLKAVVCPAVCPAICKCASCK